MPKPAYQFSGFVSMSRSKSRNSRSLQAEENRLREELRQEWQERQDKIKSEPASVKSRIPCLNSILFADEEIEITYSYWDGSGHRKKTKVIILSRSVARAFCSNCVACR